MHGYHSDGNIFYRQKPFFTRFYDCRFLDLKGFGKNVPMLKPYTLDDYVDDLFTYLADNGIINPIIIAHSFGARVVVRAIERGLKVNKLVLTGSAGLKSRFNLKRYIKKTFFKVFKKVIPDDVKQKFYSPDYLKCDPVMRVSFKYIVNYDLFSAYKSVNSETLIIFGAIDRETPIFMAKKQFKLIKNSRLCFIKGTGHFCFIDRADAFNQTVFAFLMGKLNKFSKI